MEERINLKDFTHFQSIILPESNLFESKSSELNDGLSMDEQKNRQINIAQTIETDNITQDTYNIIIASFVIYFNIQLSKFTILQELNSKTKDYIKQYKTISLTAQTNKKHFYKTFNRSVIPQISFYEDKKTKRQWTSLIIEENQNQTYQIRFFNKEGYIIYCLCYISQKQIASYLEKVYNKKMKGKKFQTLICYLIGNMKELPFDLLKLLLEWSLGQLVYIQVEKGQELQSLEQIVLEQGVLGKFKETPLMIKKSVKKNEKEEQKHKYLISSHEVSLEDFGNLKKFFNNYLIINSKFQESIAFMQDKIIEINYRTNQRFIVYYGIMYNMIIKDSLKDCSFQDIKEAFIKNVLLEKKKWSCQQTKLNRQDIEKKRPKGHYPEKIQTMGAKNCCVCTSNRKKSKYRCELCSQIYSRDIVICINHFKTYHQNPSKYIPKGVKEGMRKNQLKKLQKKKENQFTPIQNKGEQKQHDKAPAHQTTRNWDKIIQQSQKTISNFVNTCYSYYGIPNQIYMQPIPQQYPPIKKENDQQDNKFK